MIDHLPLLDLLDEAAATDPGDVGDDDLLAAAVGLEAARCRLDAAQAHVLAELERRGTTARELGLHTGPWLAREAHLPVGAARERVRVAVKLATVLPGTDAALTDGRISWDHAAVLARAANPRIAEDIAAIEDELIDSAEGTVFDVWRREVAGRAEELDQDGGHDPNRDLARNRLSASRTFDGSTHVSGLLTGEYGAVAAWVIDAHADRLFHRFKQDHKHHPEVAIPPRATLRALAFAEICRLAGAIGATCAVTPPDNPDNPDEPDTADGPCWPDVVDMSAAPNGSDTVDGPRGSAGSGGRGGPDRPDRPDRPEVPDPSAVYDSPDHPVDPSDNPTPSFGPFRRPTRNPKPPPAGAPTAHDSGTRGPDAGPVGAGVVDGRPPPGTDPNATPFDRPAGDPDREMPGGSRGTATSGPPGHPPDGPSGHPPGDPAAGAVPDPLTRSPSDCDAGPRPRGADGLDADQPRDPGPVIDLRDDHPAGTTGYPDTGVNPEPDTGPEPDPEPCGDRWRLSADGVLPRPEVLLVLHADRPGEVYTDDGIRLPGGLDNPLLADPNLYAVVTNSLGEPLDLGRQVRLATAAQRRAIRIRDGGCIFPGCDVALQHCDIHHVIPWDAQGPTNLRLLAGGCRHHHGIWHRHGWIMRATPDAWFWWQTPAGRTFWSQRHGRQRPDAPPPPVLIAPPASPLTGRTPRIPTPGPLVR